MRKKIFIFGASKAGIEILETIKKRYEVIGFIDNDQAKWNSTLQGKNIYPPGILYDYGDAAKIIIASMYYKEIIKQLRGMGFKNYYNYYHYLAYGFIDNQWLRFIGLLLSPITLLVTTPVQLLRTLWNSCILTNGNLGDFSQFASGNGITCLFYRNCAINLYRFGRRGTSKYTGNGDFKLARWFHLSLPSLYLYWIAGSVALLLGAFSWWGSHFLWLNQVCSDWLLIVLGLALCSTTFYANAFVLQNYNILGWLFFPAALYALLNQNWLMAVWIWLGISFSSITVLFIGGVISTIFAFNLGSIWPLVVLLPAILKMTTHFRPLLETKGLKQAVLSITRSIGLSGTGVKYKMANTKTLSCERRIYYLFIYIQFLIVFSVITHQISWLILTGFLIFLVNALVTRFADEQSIYMMMFSIATVCTIQIPNMILICSYWILISPPPLFLKLPVKSINSVVPVLKPFYVKPFIEGISHFLKSIPKEARVFMAFDNPDGKYEKVFTPYQGLIELLSYVATLREIHLIPNWQAIYETNHEGSPDFWGRDLQSVKENLKIWNTPYVIIYQKNQQELASIWEDNGFKRVNVFHWNDYQAYLKDSPLPETENLTWWLLYYKPVA